MNKQLSFLPEIDRKATQKRVEDMLDTVRVYKQIGFVRREIKNTPSYDPRFHGATNLTTDQVGDNASWNVDAEQRIKEITERVDKAISRLSKKEREIIIKRYLEEEDAYDYIICGEIGMSKRSYERTKARAFYKLAFMLRLEVMVEAEPAF
ncbi:ArpU family phage packaging/lysis transcriptional regulator [Aneurinibacillus aneurinilyticus]|uniref:Phage transcriptional regulator, ArpU family n=1 Tax=Aneurinibacillus aneurinilyticus ATCC 12856 TaxID=649747 RepID=U1X7F2_ANEAE|nr:ArpU family phage packaging/lysis transcriptional regulator [Aneurinibacillus aneurinilyticus]ERI10910.1 phage transcriptional regulator, ArpU family [Aneurinibacillus aneurinilyticus ATCC 12856]MED0704932.1 ArpU family phage packaging/lysis transcriptional regulator [Aneurinibacillus aneurinilyticus]MED0723072.1 ArpU family phage packaging/lysis transcriptional regulator [Aneurinibacillus aneurinilyticus]MED0731453.1 ArpU family phage packaging/lysis transcriptional regulator [Aneurinibacil